jgi:hypothetical protein
MLRFLLIAVLLPVSLFAQMQRETVLGLDVPVYNWGRQADVDYFSGEPYWRMGAVGDMANIRFALGADSVDIILILDSFFDRVYWVRARADLYPRPLEHFGSFGQIEGDSRMFLDARAIIAASVGDLYDPQTDHIYVADHMNHRLVRLNFLLDPDTPANDALYWEDESTIDPGFFPCDLAYINRGAGDAADNLLLALDCGGERLAIFSHDGALLRNLSLVDPLDSLPRTYTAFAAVPNGDSAITVYLVDGNNSIVRRLLISDCGIEYQSELRIGERLHTGLGDISWHPVYGLWLIEGYGPHIYRLAEDLWAILGEVNSGELSPSVIKVPYKIVFFPERLVIIQQTTDNTGIASFPYEAVLPKPSSHDPAPVPLTFALEHNYPNPFNPVTRLEFSIASGDNVKLEVFNILGQKVTTLVNAYRIPGRYSVIWDGRNSVGDEVSSGLYFARLVSGDKTASQKMILLK